MCHKLTTAALLLMAYCDSSRGETLSATPLKVAYQLYEPVVFRVSVHGITDPHSAPESQPLRRKIVAELWDGDVKVAEAFLSGTGFLMVPDTSHVAQTLAWGCFGTKTAGMHDDGFVFWSRTGLYDITIRDPDRNLQSDRFAVSFTVPNNTESAQAFADAGIESLALVHLQPAEPRARERIAAILRNWPTSDHAGLARILLHLVESRRVPIALPAPPTVIDDASRLTPGHPFRLYVLLDVAKAKRSLREIEPTSTILARIRNETDDPAILEKVRSLEIRP